MLTDLDAELFPDECEVVEMPLHARQIYLIQRNGSTSLRRDAEINGHRIIRNEDLRSLDFVDVYLRDPEQRYLSGVQLFVWHFMRDNVGLDRHTCETMAIKYNFLNRHYLPQWHWLVNLSRFLRSDCQIRLHPLENLLPVTSMRERLDLVPLSIDKSALMAKNSKLEFWFFIDRILLEHCGKSLTWHEILEIYREHPAQPLQVIQDRVEVVSSVLR
jgi:hypothetical protein